MYRNRHILALITARGGSKGVPRKNIRPLGSKPLIVWTVEAAKASRYIDDVVVSTDCPQIAAIAATWGCRVPFLRPAPLAGDSALSSDVVRHAIDHADSPCDIIALLQPTSPLRTGQDIDACIELCVDSGGTSVVSVTPVRKSPYWMYHLDADRTMQPFLNPDRFPLRRQDCPDLYALNGAVYVFTKDRFLRERRFVDDATRAYVMPPERSLDIDTELDFALCERIAEKVP